MLGQAELSVLFTRSSLIVVVWGQQQSWTADIFGAGRYTHLVWHARAHAGKLFFSSAVDV